jgi:hypothetical protein
VNIAAPFRCSVADRKFASYDSHCLLALAKGHSMARAVSTNPRKSASQERSRATVQVLLDATARVLTKEGYDRASTNRRASMMPARFLF